MLNAGPHRVEREYFITTLQQNKSTLDNIHYDNKTHHTDSILYCLSATM